MRWVSGGCTFLVGFGAGLVFGVWVMYAIC